ncbi:hypothetical protein ACLIXB_003714 [Yersinia enterocolitica]|nr:hypothetical protein [Yersinia enterocolitica]EKN5115593.1 hypothetical protein [Yersinia enterocolitica]EKN6381755.1 hypothetical protein [Yersinia enterocolitica]HDL7175605.1 hypothetical protein [Yersinia enterocolitica]HDL7177017.1 hypothetical protein [Yersinia enterocolitica]
MSDEYSASIERFRQMMIKELPKVPNTPMAIAELEKMPTRVIISNYITWKIRTVPVRKRTIKVFPMGIDFNIFINKYPDIKGFLNKVINGDDLNQYLSEQVRTHGVVLPGASLKSKGKDIDSFVLREGLYHFHFAPRNNKNPKGRSNYLIFADVSKDTFTIVAIAPHSVFYHGSEDALKFFHIRRMYLERDIPPNQPYMLNPVTCTGHTLEIFGYAIHCEDTINSIDPQINDSHFISQLYKDGKLQIPSLEQPKKTKLMWYFHDLNLGILEKNKGHFFGVKFLRDRL